MKKYSLVLATVCLTLPLHAQDGPTLAPPLQGVIIGEEIADGRVLGDEVVGESVLAPHENLVVPQESNYPPADPLHVPYEQYPAAPPSFHAGPIQHGVTIVPASARKVKFKHHAGLLARKVRGGEPIDVLLHVKDPHHPGCIVEIPLCVPACCNGTPTEKCWKGLLGRENVDYLYKSGYRVRVSFGKHDDIVVHTYGR